MIDSIYTDPDALRALYLNRRAIADMLPDADPSLANGGLGGALAGVIGNLPPGSTPGGEGARTGGGGCPALGQYTLARFGNGIAAVLVDTLRVGIDELWNPIDDTFRVVEALQILEGQRCVAITTLDGCVSVVSLSDPVIQNFQDTTGTQVLDLIADPDSSHGIVSCLHRKALETEILAITDAGLLSTALISLAGEGIYASGSDADAMTLRHNKRPIDDET